MRFNSDKFSFNNIHCKTKKVSLLWGDDTFIEYGLSINNPINYDGLNWKKEDNQPDTIMLHIVFEENDIAQVWTKEKIKDIESWLVTDDFAPFVSDDNTNVTYYLKAANVIRRFEANMKGWLEVEFQPISNYGYINQNITLKNTARFMNMKNIPAMTIVNQSDLNTPNYPVIEITNLSGEVSINNLTTNTNLTVTGSGNITVDNKMKTVLDSGGNNLLKDCNRQWIYLNPGENRIQVVGNCSISFKAQYEVRV